MEWVWNLIPALVASTPPLPNHHNSQLSPLIRTQNGSTGLADMSDSCQLDQLSLRRLDSSLAATKLVFHTGSGSTEVFPACSYHGFCCPSSRFFQNFLRINTYHCQEGLYMTFNHVHFRFVTFQPSNPHKLFHMSLYWARFLHDGLGPCITGLSKTTLQPPNMTTVSSTATKNIYSMSFVQYVLYCFFSVVKTVWQAWLWLLITMHD